jgi:hypothetical protein
MNPMHTILHLLLALAPLLALSMITPAPVSPVNSANLTFVWGCAPGGVEVMPVVTGQVADSVKITPINGGPVKVIENTNGSAIEKYYLIDGFDGDVDMLLDTSKTYPPCGVAGAAVLTLPVKIHMSGTAAHAIFPVTIESYSPAFKRKGETMITAKVSHRPGIDGAATS